MIASHVFYVVCLIFTVLELWFWGFELGIWIWKFRIRKFKHDFRLIWDPFLLKIIKNWENDRMLLLWSFLTNHTGYGHFFSFQDINPEIPIWRYLKDISFESPIRYSPRSLWTIDYGQIVDFSQALGLILNPYLQCRFFT